MLVLTRRVGETIIIGDREVEITLLRTRKDKVVFGIKAHEDIAVNREEIYEQKIRNNEQKERVA
jgi:carbon storage regulator CsrA